MNAFLFVFVAACWAGSFIAIKPLVAIVPPLWAGTLRIAVGAAFLTLALPILKLPLRVPREYRMRVWSTGLFAFGFPFALLFWGETRIHPGLAGILNGTVPIWVFVFSRLFNPTADPFSWRKVAGLTLGIGGLLTIFLPKLFGSETSSSLIGALAVWAMAACYATGILMNRSLFARAPALHPFTNLYQQLLSGVLTLGIIALAFEGLPRPETWTPLSTVVYTELYLGVLSTSIAFMLFYHLIRTWGAVRASTTTYVIPSMALAFDLWINRHLPTGGELGGVLLVTAGVVILNLPATWDFSRFRRSKTP